MDTVFNRDPEDLVFIYVDEQCDDLDDESVKFCDFDSSQRSFTPAKAKEIGEMLIRVAEHAHAMYTKS